MHAVLVLAALGGAHRRHGGVRIIGLVIVVALIVIAIVGLLRWTNARRTARAGGAPGEPAIPPEDRAAAAVVPEPRDSSPTALRSAPAPRPSAVGTFDPPPMRKQLPAGRYGLSGLVTSEWTKLRTVRSTMWTLGITVVLGIGISALTTGETQANWSSMSFAQRLTFDPISTSLVGLFVGQFSIGVLGALVMSAEYGTGTIRATFAASPRRPLVLLAKALVFGVVALIVAELVSFVAFFLGQALLSAPAVHATLGSPAALRAVVGGGLYICALGLLALGLASIIRHTAGAISAYVGLLLVLPLVLQALPSSILNDVRRFLPDRIGATMISATPTDHAFSPWVGLAVLCAYAAASLVVGALLLVRRDA